MWVFNEAFVDLCWKLVGKMHHGPVAEQFTTPDIPFYSPAMTKLK